MKLLKSTVFAVVMVFISVLVVSAADFKVYPGAKIDEKLTKEANDYGAKAAAGSKMAVPKATIYTTGDAYEKVYSFYKGVGKEYQMSKCIRDKEQTSFWQGIEILFLYL